mmetsp:Transcript_124064/g.247104  ORF Transcript_124064/g.247104 Transcript_124064/m.247104 type:complete len:320 (-) Transcript_124064:790-1749(-)
MVLATGPDAAAIRASDMPCRAHVLPANASRPVPCSALTPSLPDSEPLQCMRSSISRGLFLGGVSCELFWERMTCCMPGVDGPATSSTSTANVEVGTCFETALSSMSAGQAVTDCALRLVTRRMTASKTCFSEGAARPSSASPVTKRLPSTTQVPSMKIRCNKGPLRLVADSSRVRSRPLTLERQSVQTQSCTRPSIAGRSASSVEILEEANGKKTTAEIMMCLSSLQSCPETKSASPHACTVLTRPMAASSCALSTAEDRSPHPCAAITHLTTFEENSGTRPMQHLSARSFSRAAVSHVSFSSSGVMSRTAPRQKTTAG